MIIALGSTRAPKIEAVRAAVAQIAQLGLPSWQEAEILSREVPVDAPPMPISDEQLRQGARSRVANLITRLEQEGIKADLYVGLEGGLHSELIEQQQVVFLRGWAYVSNGSTTCYGSSPSIQVPTAIARVVLEENLELGTVIDRVAGEADIRSRQGTWGILTRDLVQRSHSFELALLAAFAPFYNPTLYSSQT